MAIPKNFMEAAEQLAKSHSVEESVQEIYLGNSDPDDTQVVRLLEVNNDTIPVGIQPVYFMQDKNFPFATCIIEVTQKEFDDIPEQLELPKEWTKGKPKEWTKGKLLFKR
jgi:hypothetical protein